MKMAVLDGREPTEPMFYWFDTAVSNKPDCMPMPTHMARMIERSNSKTFEHVGFEDGPEATQGLVDGDHPDADGHMEEVLAYLHEKCRSENKLVPGPTAMRVDVYISIVSF